MAEILLCNQPTHSNMLENQLGFPTDNITGLSCVNPDILNSYTPYSTEQNLSAMDRDILNLLSPMSVSRELTNLSLSFGEENTCAIAEITASLQQYNIGLMGASTSMYTNRIGGFAGAVKNYQDALMQYRETLRTNPAVKAAAKQKAITAFNNMQRRFQLELKVVTSGIKSKKGTPLTSVTRGTNIARSSRNVAKLDITGKIQAHNLVKLSKQAKFLGNGLAVIDFGSRVGSIHNSYKAGGDWERDLFIESSSFAASAVTGTAVVNAGGAVLGFLMVATPIGWVGLIVGGVVVVGAAATASIGMNSAVKDNSGQWYDSIMNSMGMK